MSNPDISIIGAGAIATEYARILKNLGCQFNVIGRGEESAARLREQVECSVLTGGLDQALRNGSVASQCIIATPINTLRSVAGSLIESGTRRILIEKPAGMNYEEVEELKKQSQLHSTSIFVAYNRRFYSSVAHLKAMAEQEGGISSFSFEFTEWADDIAKLPHAAEIKKNWFLANSSHVVDLAFWLGGCPSEWVTYQNGSLPWHPNGSAFVGAGITEQGRLFSYQANWDAPGRWGVEVLTRASRYILRPLEKLQVQRRGSVAVDFLEIDDSEDQKNKPGFHRMVKAFLFGENEERLCTIDEHARHLSYYRRIVRCN